MKKLLAVLVAVMMVFSVSACGKKVEDPTGYTYHTYSTSLGTNWNPHSWETSGDSGILGYLQTPFVDMSILDSKEGVYQWVYKAATAITDVTADHQDDLTKYNVTLPTDAQGNPLTADQVTEGFVYEIALRPEMKWEDGTPIKADDYIESFKRLMDPKMRNYRANLYYSGESAVAGGFNYYNSGAPLYNCLAYEEGGYEADLDDLISKGFLYIAVDSTEYELYSMSLSQLVSTYAGYFSNADELAANVEALKKDANYLGYTKITADNKDMAIGLVHSILENLFGAGDEYIPEALFYWNGETFGEEASFDTVGLYKVDDYTIRYVMQQNININYALTSFTDNWLVDTKLYDDNKDTSGELVTTKYMTTMATTKSYGPYKMTSLQDGKQVVFVQNENYYAFTKKEDGSLYGESNWLVDGEKRQVYQTTKIVIDVMTDDAAKQAFLKGDLDDWAPSATELVNFGMSERLYKVEETYQMSLFFNTNLNALKEMDNSKGNKNSVVLSNINFRKAFSLSIDREKWTTATAGFKAGYGLLNNLYFYNIYEDPTSSYRNSDEAMTAICRLYGVEYGDGKAYATLKEAYQSINGYNLTLAKELMKTACDELVAAGLYTAGEPIVIRIAYKKGSADSSDNQQVALFNEFINAAVEGSGFGTVEFQLVDNVTDRYGDVPAGEYAIGYGAWGGAAFYPFRNFQVYMDTEEYAGQINEIANWNPAVETKTINVDGEDVTMTYQDWSRSMTTGRFALASFETKLAITAELEYDFLSRYYRIPLASSTAVTLLSYKIDYYTSNYNIMYGFGGLELMHYNYNNKEWADYLKANKISYN
ncbi:MAG: hypothetical protein IJM15_00885 [Erysipelotrichaceae bacterium]|nr:hypothetical protein [Erysipelotrichaceae bacterium]